MSETNAGALAKNDLNLIWLDLEMTGLNPEQNRILEIGVVATGPHLAPRVEGPVLVIHQSEDELAKMDKWNRSTHGKSGLIDRVRAATMNEAEAEAQVFEFVQRFVAKHQSPMCGNSISQDRRFLLRFMPKLEAWFHYRNIDVSTLKELARRWHPQAKDSFKKRQVHRSLDDIHESIDELAHYREQFLRCERVS